MVSDFSALIGDQSSLHVDDAFARRSIYRAPVVHGMLPVMFLALLDDLRLAGWVCKLVACNARFSTAVFAGDVLELTAQASEVSTERRQAVCSFRIERLPEREVVTEGAFTVAYDELADCSDADRNPDTASAEIVGADLELHDLELDELDQGQSDSLEFTVPERAGEFLQATLLEGAREADLAAQTLRSGAFHYANLLGIAVLSTLVGMRLPGRSATFLEFSAQHTRDIELGVPYRLKGTVAHVSRATRIIKTDLSISEGESKEETSNMAGRTIVLVNRRPLTMPTLRQLEENAMDLGLRDKVAIVTGASRGIGETTAKLLALFGARVVVNYHRGKEDAERVVDEITKAGGTGVAVQADISDLDEVRAMVDGAIERFGGIDILVNNAVRDYRPISFSDLTWDDVQADLDVTVKGAMFCCKAVIPSMIEKGYGKIVAVSSVAVDDPPRHQTKYVVSKAALTGLVRSLAVELAGKNIQVNAVVPHFVGTDLVAHVSEGFQNKIAKESPMGRIASPIDVAQAVVYLASSFSSYTTGQRVLVTGGSPPFV